MSKTNSSDTSSILKNDDSNDEVGLCFVVQALIYRNCQEETSSIGSCNTTDNTSRSGTPTISSRRRRKTNGKIKKPYIPQQAPIPSLQFTFSSSIKEKHGKELFGIAFCPFTIPGQAPLFATVGYIQVTIYECQAGGGINPILVWHDPTNVRIFSKSGRWDNLGCFSMTRSVITAVPGLTTI